MSAELLASLDRTLAALADRERRLAVDLLREGPRRAGELAAELGLPPSAMSRHLKVLRASGLVEESHPDFDARIRIYRLRPEPMAELKAWLDANFEIAGDASAILTHCVVTGDVAGPFGSTADTSGVTVSEWEIT